MGEVNMASYRLVTGLVTTEDEVEHSITWDTVTDAISCSCSSAHVVIKGWYANKQRRWINIGLTDSRICPTCRGKHMACLFEDGTIVPQARARAVSCAEA